ncbi:NADPH-dependent FMN reductase [Bacillus salipaludis]|uniref:NADPH-dependent FMN reductase n=1 Tax=Bacillus salipaludis TaxID=2547811 RepID=UPI002E1F5876|nr:NADPH-dependent FMN reductase [Bacillus salipaludis]
MSNIVIISGSPSHPSRSSVIAAYLEKILVTEGNQVSTITVRDLPAEDLLFANFNSLEIKQAQSQVEQAQAVIIVSPVYKASYPGLLKSFLDLIPEKGLVNKVVLPVASGGTIAHLLSLEFAFKPVFSILGSQEIINGVFIVDSDISYKDQLTFANTDIEQRLKSALKDVVNRLPKDVAVEN